MSGGTPGYRSLAALAEYKRIDYIANVSTILTQLLTSLVRAMLFQSGTVIQLSTSRNYKCCSISFKNWEVSQTNTNFEFVYANLNFRLKVNFKLHTHELESNGLVVTVQVAPNQLGLGVARGEGSKAVST